MATEHWCTLADGNCEGELRLAPQGAVLCGWHTAFGSTEQVVAALQAKAVRLMRLERVAEATLAWSAHWRLGTCYTCLTGNDCETEMALHREVDAALAALDCGERPWQTRTT